MPQIMQAVFQGRPGGRFMEDVRHSIDPPPVIVPSFPFGWGAINARLPAGVDPGDFGPLYADPAHQAFLVEDKSVNPLLHGRS
jgi:hypothetical protein